MKYSSGFTIIEVVLFLAVSGVMVTALLIGAGTAVQRQQYRDAVQSFASYLRGQYSQVINVENDRETGRCPIATADSGSDTARGQSDCVIVGRYVETTGGASSVGDTFASYPVYAYSESNQGSWVYRLGAPSNHQLSWRAKTKLAGGDSNFSMVMYRNPDSGGLYVKLFSSRLTNSTITNALSLTTEAYPTNEICVYDDNWLSGERISVFVPAYTNSPDAITVGSVKGCSNG